MARHDDNLVVSVQSNLSVAGRQKHVREILTSQVGFKCVVNQVVRLL